MTSHELPPIERTLPFVEPFETREQPTQESMLEARNLLASKITDMAQQYVAYMDRNNQPRWLEIRFQKEHNGTLLNVNVYPEEHGNPVSDAKISISHANETEQHPAYRWTIGKDSVEREDLEGNTAADELAYNEKDLLALVLQSTLSDAEKNEQLEREFGLNCQPISISEAEGLVQFLNSGLTLIRPR